MITTKLFTWHDHCAVVGSWHVQKFVAVKRGVSIEFELRAKIVIETGPRPRPCAMWSYLPLLSGRGRSWITGLAGISGLGPNSEPRGNNRPFPETRERAGLPVKKIGAHDSIFGLVNSTYFFKITNHNQHAFNSKYLANLIKNHWTCFRYQKLADFLVCCSPSISV